VRPWYRWVRWHIRNPWEDLKKYVLGLSDNLTDLVDFTVCAVDHRYYPIDAEEKI